GTRAVAPTFVDWLQPVEGAMPPDVFSRWMKVVCVRKAPSVGPRPVPTTVSSNQGIAPGATKLGSVDDAIALAQTLLVSKELCHVARGMPLSNGFGLRKWVATCCRISAWEKLRVRNNVACGPKNVHEKLLPEGRQT